MDIKYYPDAIALYKKILEKHSDNIGAKNVRIPADMQGCSNNN